MIDIIVNKEKEAEYVKDMKDMKKDFDRGMSEVEDFDPSNREDVMEGFGHFIENLMYRAVEKK